MELTDCHSICIVSSNNLGNFEVSELGLPNKITSEDDIVKDGDLKLKCGAFLPTAISQVLYRKFFRNIIAMKSCFLNIIHCLQYFILSYIN